MNYRRQAVWSNLLTPVTPPRRRSQIIAMAVQLHLRDDHPMIAKSADPRARHSHSKPAPGAAGEAVATISSAWPAITVSACSHSPRTLPTTAHVCGELGGRTFADLDFFSR